MHVVAKGSPVLFFIAFKHCETVRWRYFRYCSTGDIAILANCMSLSEMKAFKCKGITGKQFRNFLILQYSMLTKILPGILYEIGDIKVFECIPSIKNVDLSYTSVVGKRVSEPFSLRLVYWLWFYWSLQVTSKCSRKRQKSLRSTLAARIATVRIFSSPTFDDRSADDVSANDLQVILQLWPRAIRYRSLMHTSANNSLVITLLRPWFCGPDCWQYFPDCLVGDIAVLAHTKSLTAFAAGETRVTGKNFFNIHSNDLVGWCTFR